MCVYVVKRLCDMEYGCTEIEKVFESASDAQEYIDKNQEMIPVSFSDDKQPLYSFDCWMVE